MSLSVSELRLEASPVAPFADNAAHIRAELGWVHQLLRCELRIAASDEGAGQPFDEFAGLYISKEEVERLLRDTPALGNESIPAERPAVRQWRDEVARSRRMLERRIEAAVAAGVELRFERVVRAFGLDPGERTALLCCVACELDARIPRLIAYLQNDAAKKLPTVALLGRLSAAGTSDPARLRAMFGPA